MAKSKKGAGYRTNPQRRSVETRERIIAAAVRGFARHGYEGYSVRMASNDSRRHPSLIHYHFGSKLDLWKAAILSLFRDIPGTVRKRNARAGSTDGVTELRMMFEEFVRKNAEHPEFQTLMIDAVASPDGRFDWVMETRGHGTYKSWVALIRSAQAAKKFIPGEPDMLFQLFMGAATRVYQMAREVEYNMGRSPFTPKFIQAHTKACLDLFFINGKPGKKSRR